MILHERKWPPPFPADCTIRCEIVSRRIDNEIVMTGLETYTIHTTGSFH